MILPPVWQRAGLRMTDELGAPELLQSGQLFYACKRWRAGALLFGSARARCFTSPPTPQKAETPTARTRVPATLVCVRPWLVERRSPTRGEARLFARTERRRRGSSNNCRLLLAPALGLYPSSSREGGKGRAATYRPRQRAALPLFPASSSAHSKPALWPSRERTAGRL